MSDRPPSIEGRASWIAAGVTLAILSVSYGVAVADRGRTETDPGRSGHGPVGDRAGRLAGLGRHRARRHSDGMAGGPDRHSRGRRHRRRHDGAGPGGFDARRHHPALSRPRAADRPDRQRRGLCAAADLRQPLVRPPPRHRHRADLLRPIYRRRVLARDLGARHRDLWLANRDAGLCGCRAGLHSAAVAVCCGRFRRRVSSGAGDARWAGPVGPGPAA